MVIRVSVKVDRTRQDERNVDPPSAGVRLGKWFRQADRWILCFVSTGTDSLDPLKVCSESGRAAVAAKQMPWGRLPDT